MSIPEMLKPMDVYSSSMDIPFEVAAYCRGHKFSVEAVRLSRAIKARSLARIEQAAAEVAYDLANAEVHDAIKAVESNLTTKKA
jgi:hypothetical protein